MKQNHLTHYRDIESFVTADGSVIRELLHPARQACEKQSLAEARLPVGCKTLLHRHRQMEELYYITAGSGLLTLGEEHFAVAPGDSICIPPGTAHCIENSGQQELVLLCCCSPAFTLEDCEILESMQA